MDMTERADLMMMRDQPQDGAPQAPRASGTTRRVFLRRTATMAASVALSSVARGHATAAERSAGKRCHESVRTIIDTALTSERLATTFYYAGLTTPRIAGRAGDAHDAEKLSFLRATLAQEHAHAEIWRRLGATSSHRRFYFPASSFERLGFTNHSGTYLWTLDHLETAFAGIYIAALRRLAVLGRDDLAIQSVRMLGVECQHRALYRVISQDDPADNITLEVDEFPCVDDATRFLTPFLTGRGFPHGATAALYLPTSRQVAHVTA